MAASDAPETAPVVVRGMDKPNPLDVHVGGRIRLRRTLLGISQEKLGEAIGLTFQQVQKYERGANRIGASRLYELSRVLEVPVAYLLRGRRPARCAGGSRASPRRPSPTTPSPIRCAQRETLELIRAYYRISDQRSGAACSSWSAPWPGGPRPTPSRPDEDRPQLAPDRA